MFILRKCQNGNNFPDLPLVMPSFPHPLEEEDTEDEAALMKAVYQIRPPLLLPADWLTRRGRGCRDSKDVRAHLKTCGSQILSLAPVPSCFYVGTGEDVVLKQDSYKGNTRTPRQEPEYSVLSG